MVYKDLNVIFSSHSKHTLDNNMSDEKFLGWVGHDKLAAQGNLRWEEFTPKEWTEEDIQMDVSACISGLHRPLQSYIYTLHLQVLACGVCASDLHTLRSGWGPSDYPTVVGHEIVGKVTRVGKNIKHIRIGQRVGVGAQSDSCRHCKQCKAGLESYCDQMQGTYQGNFLDNKGKSMGGYAQKWRGPGHFAVPIPDGLESHVAGPLMCGGITIFSPLQDYGCGTAQCKNVGVVGIGGIGAFGLAFAKALGAETIVAISQTTAKKDMAMGLGATDYVAMKENPEDHKRLRRSLDLIVVTANNHDQPYDKYVWMLRPRGHLVNIAYPEQAVMPIPIGALLYSGTSIGGSAIGGVPQIASMLKLAAEKKPNFMIEKRWMKDANQAILDMDDGKPRFRYALINDTV